MKLSAIHRFAIQTARKTAAGDPPLLLPEVIPRSCCFDHFRCRSSVRWKIDEGYFCQNHVDVWWEHGPGPGPGPGRYIGDHKVYRVG